MSPEERCSSCGFGEPTSSGVDSSDLIAAFVGSFRSARNEGTSGRDLQSFTNIFVAMGNLFFVREFINVAMGNLFFVGEYFFSPWGIYSCWRIFFVAHGEFIFCWGIVSVREFIYVAMGNLFLMPWGIFFC
jgi:hypothetical protein